MNTPGISTGNWRWRMLPGSLNRKLAKRLKDMTVLYRRYVPAPQDGHQE